MHTRGPWKVNKNGAYLAVEADARPDPRICYVYGQFTECPWEEAESNAHLIAAAPQLLEACKAVVARDEEIGRPKRPGSSWNTIVEKARAAIAAATKTEAGG